MPAIIRIAILLILSCTLLGCAESQREEATGKGAIRGVNAIADLFDANFLIEERSLGVVEYKSSTTSTRFDDLSFTFNFDIAIAGQLIPSRLTSVMQKITADTDYIFVLAGSLATPQILVWESTERNWDGTETVFEMAFGHASPALGSVDVYYALTGTTPVLGAAIGTLAFGERLEETEFETGEYELILTAAGIPGTVLYHSLPLTNPPAATNIAIVFDADPSLTGMVNVRQIIPSGIGIELPDSRFPSTVQLVNAALNSGNVDLVIENDFVNPPAVSNLPFGTASTDAEVIFGNLTFTYTPPASTTILFEEQISIGSGSRTMIILRGEPGSLATSTVFSNRRPISTEPQIRISNAALDFPTFDVYLSNDDRLLDELIPTLFALPFGLSSAYLRPEANSYELIITVAGEKTVLAGPLALDLANGDIIEIVVLDSNDPTAASLLEFSNLAAP